jgi:hypothetical protein
MRGPGVLAFPQGASPVALPNEDDEVSSQARAGLLKKATKEALPKFLGEVQHGEHAYRLKHGGFVHAGPLPACWECCV